jgi:hypothetical protein
MTNIYINSSNQDKIVRRHSKNFVRAMIVKYRIRKLMACKN